jgi:hypothetical protein
MDRLFHALNHGEGVASKDAGERGRAGVLSEYYSKLGKLRCRVRSYE